MHHVLVFGAGKIGSLIGLLLANSNDYKIFLADTNIDSPAVQRLKKINSLELVKLDAEDPISISQFLKNHSIETIVSCLPYYRNMSVSQLAKEFNLNYFDLTEDTRTASAEADLAEKYSKTFVPQCGLAPGFISLVANDIMKNFSELDSVKLRVGALPLNSSNALQYSLTWSTDGLINEYGNFCQAISNGEEVNVPPLDDIEEIEIDGLTYEAFNTSGGIGTLVKTYLNRVKNLNYKTIRYPGHCKKMRFLMNDLNLNDDRETLKRILESALPKTTKDVVLVYVSVTGKQNGQFVEENYVKKFYPKIISEIQWSAIQLTTASALCAILDLVMQNPKKYKGHVKQEQFTLKEFTENRFGQYYA